jgi:hypothetical protein
MVCSFTPMITNVDVVYSYDSTNDTLKATTLSGGVSNVGGPAGLSAVTTISNMLSFSQALESNIVGDQLTSVLDDLDGGNGFFNEDILFSMVSRIYSCDNAVLIVGQEEYIRGVAEYSGTVSTNFSLVHLRYTSYTRSFAPVSQCKTRPFMGCRKT